MVLAGFKITSVTEEETQIKIEAFSQATAGHCPRCNIYSKSLHGWHLRCPQDLPHIDYGIDLYLTVRRFRCQNPNCPQKTFVERFPGWLAVHARRTERLTKRMREVAFEVGGETGKRILRWFQIATSGDTLIRIMRQTVLRPTTGVRMVGIDDWALKKGRSYGTIIVDLEKQRVIDVLLERTAEIVSQWLQNHPQIELSPPLGIDQPRRQHCLDRYNPHPPTVE